MKSTVILAAFAVTSAVVFAQPHIVEIDQPVLVAEEGLLLGNGDLSVSVYQTADEIVFRLGKGDVWDRRMEFSDSCRPAHIQEFIDGELKEGWKTDTVGTKGTMATKGTNDERRMRELCQGCSNVTENWPYPCPKPTGELRMHLPMDLPGPMRIVQRLIIEEARLEIECKWKNGVRVVAEAVIPYDENVLSVRWKVFNWDGKAHCGARWNPAMPVWFAMWRWQDPDYGEWASRQTADCGHSGHLGKAKNNPKVTSLPPPKSFMFGSVGCIEQEFYPDNIFRDGFKYRLSLSLDPSKYGETKAIDFAGKTKDAWVRAYPVKGDCAGEISLAVTTSRDKSLVAPKAKSHAEYRQATVDAARADWARRSFLIPGDSFLENLWYSTCHARRCILKGGTVPPGLFFPSTVQDFSYWHGDYHSNYNVEAIYWGAMTANQMRQEAAYFDCIDFYRPIGEKIAKEYYGTRGCFIQLEGFPVRGEDDHNGNLPLGRMAYMTGWLPEPHFEWYKMTLDKDWLAKRGYPFIKDCALFYLDFLKKAPNENLPPELKDGKYHIFPSIQGESGFSGNPMDVCDKPQALKHCRHALWMAVEASKALDVDDDLRLQWEDRMQNLAKSYVRSEFKPGTEGDYEFYCSLAREPAHGGKVWAPPVKWDGKLRVPRRNESWYQGILTTSRIAMMRDNTCIPERDFPYLRDALEKWTHANGLVWAMAISCYGRSGAWTETLSAMAPFQEMLLQSWDGSIRLFPRWPKDRDVAFSGWRAQGAFLVSGEQKSGRVSAKVTSEKGADCLVVGDWKVADSDGKLVATDHDAFGRLRFKTAVGASYDLERK